MNVSQMRPIGFWRELTKDPKHPSIFKENMGVVDTNKPLYLEYLNTGKIVLAIRTVGIDVLSNKPKNIFAYNFYTDGIWVWSSALMYYVKEYDMQLPKAFIDHILNQKGVMTPVSLTVSEQNELCAQISAEMKYL
jgi:hypothetical protein